MIQVTYRWEVAREDREAFLSAWERTTKRIRDTLDGAHGNLCTVHGDLPQTDSDDCEMGRSRPLARVIKTARSDAMREMHLLGTQLSHEAYEQPGDFTV